MGFLRTLTVGAIGYVLGARAGRKRYEQIKAGAQRLWESNTVRQGRDAVRNQAAETFAQAQEAATAKFAEAAEAVKDKVRSDDSAESWSADEIVVDEIRVEAVRVDDHDKPRS
ncbi:hypothetical protein [Trueperella bialowiezensis]|uniref:Uncharacterized protein n=1 Tax=Trueperella bialowiezensis TaxID=312285 RepID=A0A448PER4_9ACTO|nr:hypothetical protein [Trueperella bialowiezensis]VEI13416.1 Uncharacterised protein [Trueperella bialowiezensis]